jgi:hypothetical protein
MNDDQRRPRPVEDRALNDRAELARKDVIGERPWHEADHLGPI